MWALWILGFVLGYLFVGLIIACISMKMDGKCLDRIDTGDDIIIPMIFWPLMIIVALGFLCCGTVKRIFSLTAVHIFRIPAATSSSPVSGFVQGSEHGGGTNPPPKTVKPKKDPPPQKAVKDKKPTSRSDLIDMDW